MTNHLAGKSENGSPPIQCRGYNLLEGIGPAVEPLKIFFRSLWGLDFVCGGVFVSPRAPLCLLFPGVPCPVGWRCSRVAGDGPLWPAYHRGRILPTRGGIAPSFFNATCYLDRAVGRRSSAGSPQLLCLQGAKGRLPDQCLPRGQVTFAFRDCLEGEVPHGLCIAPFIPDERRSPPNPQTPTTHPVADRLPRDILDARGVRITVWIGFSL